MAKYYNNIVKKGKLGGSVFAVRNGVTIERIYQPTVFNPSTPGQVAARAKMKLMSQLSAVLASVMVMPRIGLISPRNRFVKANYGLATYAQNTAQINVADIKLTNSVVSLPALSIDRSGNNSTVSLVSPDTDINRMVYVVLAREADNTLRLVAQKVETNPGSGSIWGSSIPLGTTGEVFVLGYGVRDNTENARAVFGNMEVPSAEAIAELVVSRTLTETDVTLTETRGIYSSQAPA